MLHYQLTRALHFIGIILWMGGTITTAMLASYAAEQGAGVTAAARKVLLRIATPAMIAAWVGGLGMLIPLWSSTYARAGWMHGKLLLVLVASGLSGALSGTLRRAEGGTLPAAKVRAMGVLSLGLVVAVAVLAVLKPGA